MQFEPGAPAPKGLIPLSVPEIGGKEWEYVKECLDTNWVSSAGSFVDRFETSLAQYTGAQAAVATNNGTAALHVALLAAGIQPEDEVLVPTLSFIAPANTVRYVGGWPVFMDVEPRYWQMDSEKVADFLDNSCRWQGGKLVNKVTGRRVKAVLPVHILGHPCDMGPILEAAQKYELLVIEDASESLGAKYKGRMTGRLGDIGCFSFNGNKIVTCGGGGMIVTDNQDWADQARYLTTQAKDDPLEYIHNEIGYNYRLTNLQAAVGFAQMERLDEFIEAKRVIARRYVEALEDVEGLTLMPCQPGAEPTYWLYTVLLHQGVSLEQRQEYLRALIAHGIEARPLWHTLHDLPPYGGCQAFKIEQATRIYHRAISLPSSVGLNAEDQARCTTALRRILLG